MDEGLNKEMLIKAITCFPVEEVISAFLKYKGPYKDKVTIPVELSKRGPVTLRCRCGAIHATLEWEPNSLSIICDGCMNKLFNRVSSRK